MHPHADQGQVTSTVEQLWPHPVPLTVGLLREVGNVRVNSKLLAGNSGDALGNHTMTWLVLFERLLLVRRSASTEQFPARVSLFPKCV